MHNPMKIPLILKVVFSKLFLKKVIAIVVFVAIMFILREFLILFLVIFLISYLFIGLGDFVELKTDKFFKKHKGNKFLSKLDEVLTYKIIISILYILFVLIVVLAVSDMVPLLINELRSIAKDVPAVQQQIDIILSGLTQINDINSEVGGNIKELFSEKNYDIFLKVINSIKQVGNFVLQFMLAVIISFFIILDRKKILKFLKPIKSGNFSFFYKEYKNLFAKIRDSFGLIFKAQALIAVANTVITIVGFYIIGLFFGGFPYILTMGIIVFLASFIPIAGMWISAIPLCFVAFTIGGLNAAILVFMMVIITTSIEAYVLNPRIVSSYLEFPISVTFIILFISEHMFGVIGLLVGVPLFHIAIAIFKDFDLYIDDVKKEYRHLKGK